MTDLSYDAWPSVEPKWHEEAARHTDDNLDFHVDLGCGKLKKARIGVDHYPAAGVNILTDLDRLRTFAVASEPGADCFEQMGNGQIRLHFGAGSADYYPGGYFYPQPELHDRLPFAENSVESMISHHTLEHIGTGFIALMDECYRVLKPGAPFRIIVPLFPSATAVADPTHVRWFMDRSFESFCGFPDECWLESFSVPYTKARFEMTDHDVSPPTPPEKRWTPDDRREMRLTLRPRK